MLRNRVVLVIAVCGMSAALLAGTALAYEDTGHEFIFDKAQKILANDGFSRYASWTSTNLSTMKRASHDADHCADVFGLPLAASSHFMDKYGNGLLYAFPSSGSRADQFMSCAFAEWYAGRRANAAYCLGVVCHLTQDATVPHHSTLNLLNWHSGYESKVYDYTYDRPSDLTVTSGGYYNWDWWRWPWYRVQKCADASDDYLPYCDGWNPDWYCWWITKDDPLKVAKKMVPYAERETAGVIAWFLWMVGY